MIAAIDAAREAGDTLGGSFEVIARGVPVGLGSHVQWDRKLDGRLGQALMSIPAIKAVGIGRGPGVASLPGSRIHDEILPATSTMRASQLPVARPTNNAGGLEGGITNGQDLRVTAYMKPIATLMKPLRSIDINTNLSRTHATYAFWTLYQQGKLPQALDELQRSLKLYPLSLDVRRMIAYVQLSAGQYAEAVDNCRYVLKADPICLQ